MRRAVEFLRTLLPRTGERFHHNVDLQGDLTMKRVTVAGSVALLFATIAWAQETTSRAKRAPTADSLKADIDALKAPKVAWREIAWKSCLLEGLKESRAKNKPALLWVFIDRPIDDARC
jgi:hypothetical protein